MTIKLEKRVFIGIPVGLNIKHILPQLKSTFNSNPNIIKWIPENNIHLTLSFLGNIPSETIPEIVDSLEKSVMVNYFKIKIENTGVFPTPKSPKILWMGINKGADDLITLQLEIEKSVRELKKNVRKDKYIPHVTIARIHRSHRKIDVLPFLKCVYSPIELDINSVCLYESLLLPEGAQYTVLTEFPLN